MRSIQALLLAALAAACNVVTSAEPLGTRPLVLDATQWDGTWLYAEGTIHLKVTDAAAGRLQLVTLDETDGRIEASSSKVQLLSHDGWTFANVTVEEEPDTNYWLRVEREGRQLIAWFPHPVAFAEAVKAGHLPGELDEHDNVHLPVLTPAQLEVITDSRHGILIQWEEPLAFLRVSDKAGL